MHFQKKHLAIDDGVQKLILPFVIFLVLSAKAYRAVGWNGAAGTMAAWLVMTFVVTRGHPFRWLFEFFDRNVHGYIAWCSLNEKGIVQCEVTRPYEVQKVKDAVVLPLTGCRLFGRGRGKVYVGSKEIGLHVRVDPMSTLLDEPTIHEPVIVCKDGSILRGCSVGNLLRLLRVGDFRNQLKVGALPGLLVDFSERLIVAQGAGGRILELEGELRVARAAGRALETGIGEALTTINEGSRLQHQQEGQRVHVRLLQALVDGGSALTSELARGRLEEVSAESTSDRPPRRVRRTRAQSPAGTER